MGIKGTSIATVITHTLNLTIATLYVNRLDDIKEAIFFPDSDSYKGLGNYFKLGGPSIAMLCMEWWSFEIMTLIAGYISVDAIATQIIVVNSGFILY